MVDRKDVTPKTRQPAAWRFSGGRPMEGRAGL